MEENSIQKPKAWNPILLGVLSFLFSFLPAGIFYAINFERLGYPQKKNVNLVLVIIGFIIFTVVLIFIPKDINPIPFYTLINASIAGYFIYSQKKLYEKYLADGNEKASPVTPIFVSILINMCMILTVLYIPFGQPSELELNPEKAFVEAADHGNIDIIEELIEQGIDVDVYYKSTTALYEAAVNGNAEILKLLVQAGANANAEDKDGGVTPLYMVSMENRGGFEKTNEIIKLLIDGGADPNIACTESKITPLMWFVYKENIEGIKYILKNGADVNLKREDGNTALSLAIKDREEEIITILKSYGAIEIP